MKVYLTRSYGPEARFEAAEIPVPEPASGQILIEVKATSLNPIDNMFLRQDLGFNPELPAVLHGDVTDASASTMNKNVLARLDLGLINEALPSSDCNQWQRGRGSKVKSAWFLGY